MSLEPVLRFLHIAGVTLWVGGMFFAYVCLRPAAGALLEPPQRLRLWRAVFATFLGWVWVAVAVIAGSGAIMIARAGMAAAPPHWHLMLGTGLLMIAIFVYVFAGPYGALRRAVDAQDWPAAGAALGRIRRAVGVNLLLGGLTIAVATLGQWLR
ncbi:CopD family protein [Cupriavidus sp. WS]|uniref:CopD family protein n=1 Tax=Cupriavidus sp. WS TaxID=1312922 RepID=UPI00035C1D1E|nr:CopD family protein [Cupriavidus sp. WS]